MDVTVDRKQYRMCVRDGSSEDCNADIPLPVLADRTTLQFMDVNGKQIQVLDKETTSYRRSISLTAPA